MSGRSRVPFLMAAALLLGLGVGELLYRSPAFRDLAGPLFGRGRLVTVTNGKGIYQTDLGGEDEPKAEDLVLLENLRAAAANEPVHQVQIDRAIALLAAQFGSDKAFRNALRTGGFSLTTLRERVTNQLRGLGWLEKKVRSAEPVAEPECRKFYEAHHDFFTRPVRYRVTHLFLAAHSETSPDVVEEKELAIAGFATRLSQGETLAQLAAEASEDEASKPHGGDLGYFAETRVPAEFTAEIKKLRVAETSKPFRSHLGFHIARLTETKQSRLLTFDECRPEIFIAFTNARRAATIQQISEALRRSN